MNIINLRKNIIKIVLIIFGILVAGLAIYSLTPDNFIRNAFNEQFNVSYSVFLRNYILAFVIYFLIATILLISWRIILNNLENKVSDTVLNTLRILGRMIIVPFFVVAYLNQFEVFSGTLVGLAALLGTAVGFASSKTIGNFIAGLYIILSKPFHIKDYIILPGLNIEGVVREISINYTRIDKPEGNTAVIPNNNLLDSTIINIRKSEEQIEEKIEEKHFYSKILNKGEEKVIYIYPIKWRTDSDDQHVFVEEAIEKTAKEYEKQLVAPVYWAIESRDRFHREYRIDLAVEDPYTLLNLTGEFLKSLERNYEPIRKKI